MKVAVIGEPEMVLGFAVAGIKRIEVASTSRDAAAALNRCLGDGDIGVIFIQDRVSESIRGIISQREHQKEIYPLIIEIPGKKGPVKREDPLRRIIRRAVGVDVREKVCRRE